MTDQTSNIKPPAFDASGWAIGRLEPFSIDESFALLSPEPEARIDEQRWMHQASVFFRAEIQLNPKKNYPSGTTPLVDAVLVGIATQGGLSTNVLVITLPWDRAPEVRHKATAAVQAIGGAGFDALLKRTRRLWQVCHAVAPDGDPRAPLAVAAVLASLYLAPIVPPLQTTIFGVKGARTRLDTLGWKT